MKDNEKALIGFTTNGAFWLTISLISLAANLFFSQRLISLESSNNKAYSLSLLLDEPEEAKQYRQFIRNAQQNQLQENQPILKDEHNMSVDELLNHYTNYLASKEDKALNDV